jgi:hypothetical protein
MAPWEELTSLDIGHAFPSGIVRRILEHTPKLISGSFEIADPPLLDSISAPKQEMTVCCLHHLTVKLQSVGLVNVNEGVIDCRIAGFFRSFAMPALQVLKVEASHSSFDNDFPGELLQLQAIGVSIAEAISHPHLLA